MGQCKLWSIATQNHFGGKNIGRLAALHGKSARMKGTKLWWIGHELPNLYIKVFTAKILCCTIILLCISGLVYCLNVDNVRR